MSRFVATLLLGLSLAPIATFARDVDGRWAQILSQDMRDWFRAQKSPKTGGLCCDEADGEAVEEDIRDNQYWIRSPKTHDDWIPVPHDVVITRFVRGIRWALERIFI